MSKLERKTSSLDVELAVALEVGLTRLERAEQLGGLAQAQGYNRDLWRVIGELAAAGKVERLRDELRQQAVAVSQGRGGDFVAINRRFAGLFAAQSAAYGAMSVMLNDWRLYRRNQGTLEFSLWLLQRLDAQIERRQAA